MLTKGQIWENKTKIAKLEQNNGHCNGHSIKTVIFKIKKTGLSFENTFNFSKEDLEKFLKKTRMKLTDKILTLE